MMTLRAPQIARITAATMIAAVFTACSDDNVTACTDIAFTGVTVVVPGGSALSRLGRSISGTLTDGTYSETMNISASPNGEGSAELLGAVERSGTYSLLVRVAGYQDFQRTNIVVSRTTDGCHVKPVSVIATLTQ